MSDRNDRLTFEGLREELREVRAENAKLLKEVFDWRSLAGTYVNPKRWVALLEAERDRYREALKQIAAESAMRPSEETVRALASVVAAESEMCEWCWCNIEHFETCPIDIARTALEKTK